MVYIAHHGIRGQRWGKRNGPPYPLDDGDHSASEKKSNYKLSIKKSKNLKTITTKSPDTNSKFQLSDKQKKILKTGAMAAGIAIAAIGAYELGRYSNIKRMAGKAAAQKALNEIRKQTTDMLKNYDFSTEFGNMSYESDKKQITSKIINQNRQEYRQLTKNAWNEDISKQIEKLKRGPNDIYEKSLKKQMIATDVIERYAANNHLDLNSIKSNSLTKLQDATYDALDKIKNRKVA